MNDTEVVVFSHQSLILLMCFLLLFLLLLRELCVGQEQEGGRQERGQRHMNGLQAQQRCTTELTNPYIFTIVSLPVGL